jgi:acyl-CoA reductase-like NAD-dependent aldehyde dehydrogenase
MTDPADLHITKVAAVVPISQEALDDAIDIADHLKRWTDATPEQRDEWNRQAVQQRAAERAATTAVPLTLDGLLDKLGFTHEYAQHLVQPYCECADGYDGWETCQHAYDLGLR